jgi:DNA-binding transcriptional LysR family regulator
MESRAPDVDLSEIFVFLRVVQRGSLTAASTALRMPKSTVSRKLSDLEKRVGARLLQRTTRRISLTDIGRAYYDHCVRIAADIEEAQAAVARLQATPRGLLRVSAPVAFSLLGPIVAEYLRLQPEVELELVCTDRRVDLVEERYDLALRAGETPDSSLVARPLGSVRRVLVAAPSVVSRLGRIRQLSDLERSPCLAFAPEGNTWELTSGAKTAALDVRPRLTVNDYEMLCSVARSGFGIALVPDYLCADDLAAGRLARVLESWSAPEVPVFALYPSARHLAPTVASFLELLRERLAG